jgi:hypothetical protein
MQHQQTPTPPPPPQRLTNAQRLTQWREIAERTGNAKLINTVDILEIRYANDATRPPVPASKGGAK